MSTKSHKRLRWMVAGLTGLLAGAVYVTREAPILPTAMNPTVDNATTQAVFTPNSPPITFESRGIQDEQEVDFSKLPPDAGIYPTVQARVGGGHLDVVAGELVAKFDSALSQNGIRRLLNRMGSRVLLADARTGYLRIEVPEGESIESFQAQLLAIDGVITAHANVLMKATANKCATASEYYDFQWNLQQYNHSAVCSSMPQDPVAVVVAVLDSGCAYLEGDGYAQAAELANVPIIAPYDFVNDDDRPNDDNGHGTHIASIALGSGKINGVTPGASLMPLKVLDAKNKGSELALAQALYWAADNGANIINMSLTFPAKYVPSALLSEAISYAAASGAMLIASSGNKGKEGLAYPAQYRDVLSVGAVRMKRLEGGEIVPTRAKYSSYGAGLDAVTWGGDLKRDANHDDYPDGILGPSIKKHDPSGIRYVFYVGTSQAAAQASGIATWLMAAGADAKQARDAMLQTARDLGEPGYDKYYGQGLLSLNEALSSFNEALPIPTPKLYINILPVVYKDAGMEWAVARVKVSDVDGYPVPYAEIYGQWNGAVADPVQAVADENGEVLVASPQLEDDDKGAIFALEISSVVHPTLGRTVRPAEFYYLGEGLAALLEGTLSQEATLGTLIAFHVDPELDDLKDVFDLSLLAESYTIKGIGPSLSTPGIGITFTPDLIPGLAEGNLEAKEIKIEFGSDKAFGYGKSDEGHLKIYNGGVGLALSNLGKSGGVGLALSNLTKNSGVGLALSNMGRLGGVGLALSNMSVLRLDPAIITGQTVDEPADFIKTEDPDSFLEANPDLEESELGYSLEFTRFAANSADSAELDGIIAAQTADEAEADLESEFGQSEDEVDLEDALSTDPDPSEEAPDENEQPSS